MHKLLFALTILVSSLSFGQSSPKNGVNDEDPTIYVFRNARIFVSSEKIIEDGMLIIQNNRILNVGATLTIPIPKGSVEIDCKGKEIYPSFVEIFSEYGVQKEKPTKRSEGQQLESNKGANYYWNQAMNSEFSAAAHLEHPFKEKKELIDAGFGVLSSHRKDGVSRGTGSTFLLDNQNGSDLLKSNSATFYSFSKGSSRQSYPSSQMGSIALLKQFFYDLEWYTDQKEPKNNITLNSELENAELPKIFEVYDKLEALRVVKLAKELNMKFILKSGGNEYESIEEISASEAQYIIPLNFPAEFDMSDPYDSRFVSLEELKEWYEAPSNPYFLFKKNVDFCLTSDGLKPSEFLANLRKAIKRGLPVNEAVKRITQTPSEYLQLGNQIGTLDAGKFANFIITEPNFFLSTDSKLLENWIGGIRHEITNLLDDELTGTYGLNLSGKIYDISFSKKGSAYIADLSYIRIVYDSLNQKKNDTLKVSAKVDYTGTKLSFSLPINDGHFEGIVSCNGSFYKALGIAEGNANYNSGDWFKWSLIRSIKPKPKKETPDTKIDSLSLTDILRYPNMAYGFDTLPQQKTYFIRNATIWTNEAEHVLKGANLLIQDGKIKFIGTNTVGLPMDVIMIDAKGKYVTSGIIDEHSHIAISKGVNESGQNNSAEVTIEDVINPEDINIYRHLAGGVTTSQLLHGSANPIGGRSALIKLKWGFPAADYLIPDADGFIKFALGENVKQSNSSSYNTVRYPQTRLGVEQVFVDAFTRAVEYGKKWEAYNKLTKKQQSPEAKPRRDLELEVMLEILQKERFVTCHSYIQSEINMLMHVADTFGFSINTFTHALEGYKLADKMKTHGAGGSTFSDWWAYKYEVKDAIPYNAAIMNNQGVVVAINSDDAEMGRRLNQEAAKTIKYGGMTEQEAWKMVTLNPAKLLHLDERMGSIKVGKDADIVIWSDNPLSINAKVEKTFVDGYLLFDLNMDEALRKRNADEKARILSAMIKSADGKMNLNKPSRKNKVLYHCNKRTVNYFPIADMQSTS